MQLADISDLLHVFPLGKTGGLIEAHPVAVDRRRGPGFRWVKPAASLKRYMPVYATAAEARFPLGKTGGLIEAIAGLAEGLEAWVRFPLGKTGGLIEAQASRRPSSPASRFPLGKTGGLIEAG